VNSQRKFILALTASALVLASCQQAETPEEDQGHSESSWGYSGDNGPQAWGKLSQDYSDCSAGSEQSPIDITAPGSMKKIDVATEYGAAEGDVENNGHTIVASLPEGFTMTSGETTYNFVQVHFHTPSEHLVEGKTYPLVAHLVHATEDSRLAVLGVFFEEGEANPALQAILDGVDGKAQVDLAGLTPESKNVGNYAGSLTTPPCSEGVNWHVSFSPMTASADQIAKFSEIMGKNARPVQPLNARELGG